MVQEAIDDADANEMQDLHSGQTNAFVRVRCP